MNVSQVVNLSLKLMDEYSLSGALEGGQLTADYTLKMVSLINLAQNEISDHIGILATFTIDTVTTPPDFSQNGWNFWLLPSDMKDFRYTYVDNWPSPFNDYQVVDNGPLKYFKLASGYNTSVFIIHYFKYPLFIADNADQTTTNLEVDEYAQWAIPYFVAGMCGSSSSEDLQLSDKLMSVWATKLNAMTKRELRYPRRSRMVVEW